MKTYASRRGVSLIEGLMATMVLLTGMVGVFQGMLVASVQNSMANRRTRATVMAAELSTTLGQLGRAALTGAGGPFSGAMCQASLPTEVSDQLTPLQLSEWTTVPSNFSEFEVCFIDVSAHNSLLNLARPYVEAGTADENSDIELQLFNRIVAVYINPANTEIIYLRTIVAWRELGSMRSVQRMTAVYDSELNQTNVEL